VVRAFRKALTIGLVLCACVGCDQVTKDVAEVHLPSAHSLSLLGGVLQFRYSTNTGAFMGLGARLPSAVRFWALIVLVGIALAAMLRFLWVSQEMRDGATILGLSLVIGGGFSNLVSRLRHGGAVVDFVSVGVGSLRTGIFNLADVAIMVGAGILLAWGLFLRDTLPARRG
jgi:signal peptidase II